jgi:hypothetical protein
VAALVAAAHLSAMGRSTLPKGAVAVVAPSKTSTKEGLSGLKAQGSSLVLLPLLQ